MFAIYTPANKLVLINPTSRWFKITKKKTRRNKYYFRGGHVNGILFPTGWYRNFFWGENISIYWKDKWRGGETVYDIEVDPTVEAPVLETYNPPPWRRPGYVDDGTPPPDNSFQPSGPMATMGWDSSPGDSGGGSGD